MISWVEFLMQKMIIRCYLYIPLRHKYPLRPVLDKQLLRASPPGQLPLILICLSWLHCWCRLICTCSMMTNPQLCSRLSPHIGQCCKAPLPPKLDRQLLQTLPLERLPCLWSWFHLRKSCCSSTMRTNLQLRSQLNIQDIILVVVDIISKKEAITCCFTF